MSYQLTDCAWDGGCHFAVVFAVHEDALAYAKRLRKDNPNPDVKVRTFKRRVKVDGSVFRMSIVTECAR